MSGDRVKSLELEAMVVDDLTGGNSIFRRWEFNYPALDRFYSPEPSSTNRNNEIEERGVWIRFVLPRELRTKKEDMQDYPCIPNRWLIIRSDGIMGNVKSWVLEGDCPVSDHMEQDEKSAALETSSMYLISEQQKQIWENSSDPYRKNALTSSAAAGGYHVNMGVAFEAANWGERDDSPLFLTACAPGNPIFSAYAAHNRNILSFFDEMEGMDKGELDYFVVGWYSNFQLPDVYAGRISGIHWNKGGVAVTKEQDIYRDELAEIVQGQKLNVAVGASTEEAFRAYLNRRFTMDGKIPEERSGELDALLAALYYNVMDHKTSPAGRNRLENIIHDNKFESRSGGTKYVILSETEGRAELTQKEQDLLDRLNRFDDELELLTAMRQRLLEMWWKKGYLKTLHRHKNPRKPEDYDMFFDVTQKDSLVSSVMAKMHEVRMLYEYLPKEGEKLEQYGRDHGVKDGHILKALPKPRYWREGNPVILINGTEPAEDLKTGEYELLPQFNCSQVPKCPELPEELQSILEIVRSEAADGQGEIKKEQSDWYQPWKPVFMEWIIEYQPVNLESFFFDGTDYQYRGSESGTGELWQFGGISHLDAHHKSVFAQRISQLSEQTGISIGQALKEISGWKLLSQELVSLKDGMAQQDYRTFRRPYREPVGDSGYTLDEILGFSGNEEGFWEASGGRLESVPLISGDSYPPFTPFQAGRGKIAELFLYDAFGRVMPLILSGEEKGLFQEKNFPLIRPEYMAAGRTGGFSRTENRNEFWMKPRLLQYGRLHFEFLRTKEKEMVHGYIIVNHMNRSLLLYAPDGSLAGELIGIYTTSARRKVMFRPAGRSGVKTTEELIEKYPVLGSVAQARKEGTPEAFWEFLDTIDRAIWTIGQFGSDSDEDIALSFGRPLALLRAESFIELDGTPRQDAGWKGGFQAEQEALCGRKFPVRIGDKSIRDDGVVGYFLEDRYDEYHSIAMPEGKSGNIRQIGPVGTPDGNYAEAGYGKKGAAVMTILADPRGTIHAYTGIFPVKEVRVPQEEITGPLRRMEVQFQAGPFVTRIIPGTDGTHAVPEIGLPAFPHSHGTWSYGEQEEEYGLTVPENKGDQGEGRVSVREGILKYFQNK
ncbi:hypothetical protein AALH30_09655 [Blautia pseudococcoides]|uniref:hypothetical protein n=1 Tax=Blautia pseudococcoides TaxID=1796616 RepID=UPI003513394F